MTRHEPSEPMKRIIQQHGLDAEQVWENTQHVYNIIVHGPRNNREADAVCKLLEKRPCPVDVWDDLIDVQNLQGGLLFQAAHHGRTFVIKPLIEAGCLSETTPEMRTEEALTEAIRRKKTDAALALVEHGVGINTPRGNNRRYPLHEAIDYDQEPVLDALLKRKDIVVDVLDLMDQTPLMVASRKQPHAMLKLLQHGADPNYISLYGHSALSMSYGHGNTMGIRHLAALGADMTLTYEGKTQQTMGIRSIGANQRSKTYNAGTSVVELEDLWNSLMMKASDGTWEDLVQGIRQPQTITLQEIYRFCNIGKADDIFRLPGWTATPEAADHALELIRGMIPYYHNRFVIAAEAIAPFGTAAHVVGSAEHHGMTASAPTTQPQNKR